MNIENFCLVDKQFAAPGVYEKLSQNGSFIMYLLVKRISFMLYFQQNEIK